MSPFDDYTAHLFPSLPPEKITTLSCGHVIPPENLCVWTLASSSSSLSSLNPGGSAADFEFSFQKRGDRAMIRNLGIAILNICAVVPDGVVVFFPSYGYLDEVVGVWSSSSSNNNQAGLHTQAQATATTIWQKLQMKKAVFRETKGGSSDEVLGQYSRAILGGGDQSGNNNVNNNRTPTIPVTAQQQEQQQTNAAAKRATMPTSTIPTKTGALLLSVVGGKMSEGINFSDRLGRCVVIVGLPYPNINSADWKARIEYVESTTLGRLLQPPQHHDLNDPPSNPNSGPDPSPINVTKNDGSIVSTTGGTKTTATAPAPAPASAPASAEARAKAKQTARDFYENACMRAVNQSIGRAVRHRADYAAIVLLDRRFAADRIRGKLPGWIRAGLEGQLSPPPPVGGKGVGASGPGSGSGGLGQMMGRLSVFFRGKKREEEEAAAAAARGSRGGGEV